MRRASGGLGTSRGQDEGISGACLVVKITTRDQRPEVRGRRSDSSLEDLLRQRRIEAWRMETATEAKNAAAAFRSGKLKAQSAASVIARLRTAK